MAEDKQVEEAVAAPIEAPSTDKVETPTPLICQGNTGRSRDRAARAVRLQRLDSKRSN